MQLLDFNKLNTYKSVTLLKCLICLSFVLNVFWSKAQTNIYNNYNSERGLPQSKVYALAQDSLGYLWVGTKGGLAKFNGLTFETYTVDEGMGEDIATQVLVDEQNNVWIGHEGGSISVIKKDTIISYRFKLPKSEEYLKSRIHKLFLDSKGKLWIGTGEGLIIINDKDKSLDDPSNFQFWNFDSGLSDIVLDILEDKQGKMWLVTTNGIKTCNSDAFPFETFLAEGFVSTQYLTIYESKDGTIWFGALNKGLAKFDHKESQVTYFHEGLKDRWITDIIEDDHDDIWVSTWRGGIAKLQNNKFRTIGIQNGLSDYAVRCMLLDQENNIWIGTNEGGLDYYKGEMFINYLEGGVYVNDAATAIHQTVSGDWWIGSNKGITILSNTDGNLNARQFKLNSLIQGKSVDAIQSDNSGNVWIGVFELGVIKYNVNSGKHEIYNVGNHLISDFITTIAIDKDQNVWIGTRQGITRYNSRNKTYENFGHVNGLASDKVTQIFEDSKGRIWIGGESGDGLTVWENAAFKVYGTEDGMTHHSPSSVTEDQSGNIWIGTEGRGVFKFDGSSFTSHRVKDGLLSDFILSIIADNDGNVWIGTHQGLCRLDANKGAFTNYGKQEGFLGVEAKQNAVFKAKDGSIWFGHAKGFCIYNANNSKNINAPKLRIKSFYANYESINIGSEIVLDHDQNQIKIEYSGLYFSNPTGLKYSYMLEGLDNANWSYPETKNSITFPALAYGNYTLNVKAINSQGIENKNDVKIAFTIRPPFYLTSWFLILCVIVVGATTFGFISWRTQKLKRDKQILEEKVAERTRELEEEKKVVEEQKEEIAEKNKDITDSIKYAEKIQTSILPMQKDIATAFPESFVLYKPRDIVSGDFYWFKRNNDEAYIAAVDCTGHGVPGAFMSMIGYSQLNQITGQGKQTEPAKILDALSDGVRTALRQTESEDSAKDGMDLALCKLNLKSNELTFSGAYRPLYLLKNGEIEEVKADKFPIGGTDEGNEYTDKQIKLEKGDAIYIFSDGYPDQFGGEKGKKFMTKRFKNLLVEVMNEPMDKQKEILDEQVESWRGNLEQVDDILVIGIKIT